MVKTTVTLTVAAARFTSKGEERPMSPLAPAAIAIALLLNAVCVAQDTAVPDTALPSYHDYLRTAAVPKDVLDVFLDPNQRAWARFDPELGYRLGNSLLRDGIDGSRTISTAQADTSRTPHMYVHRPCRINTYGNSFTQCHQVSDGETWQEYLAAHFGEPIRNYGMGGYGTFQAYRRMVRVEQSPQAAENIIFYLWGDDHLRSVMRCRYALIHTFWDSQGGLAFHNNFWANLEMDLESAEFVERDNLLPTPESLYKMSDPEFMVSALDDDLMLQLCVARRVDVQTLDLDRIDRLAACLGTEGLDRRSNESIAASCERLMHEYGFAATRLILDNVAAFCRDHNKRLLIVLLCPRATKELLRGHDRYDQSLLDFIRERGFHYFDMNQAHLDDFADFRIGPDEYLKRYFIGHYSPAGNHFFAFQVKNAILEMLDPPPVTYSREGKIADFTEYLTSTTPE